MSELATENTKEKMQEIATKIQTDLDGVAPRLGFSLIVFEFGGSNRVNYISNANRGDMIQAHRDLIDQLED
jgi:hypothetical protein